MQPKFHEHHPPAQDRLLSVYLFAHLEYRLELCKHQESKIAGMEIWCQALTEGQNPSSRDIQMKSQAVQSYLHRKGYRIQCTLIDYSKMHII